MQPCFVTTKTRSMVGVFVCFAYLVNKAKVPFIERPHIKSSLIKSLIKSQFKSLISSTPLHIHATPRASVDSLSTFFIVAINATLPPLSPSLAPSLRPLRPLRRGLMRGLMKGVRRRRRRRRRRRGYAEGWYGRRGDELQRCWDGRRRATFAKDTEGESGRPVYDCDHMEEAVQGACQGGRFHATSIDHRPFTGPPPPSPLPFLSVVLSEHEGGPIAATTTTTTTDTTTDTTVPLTAEAHAHILRAAHSTLQEYPAQRTGTVAVHIGRRYACWHGRCVVASAATAQFVVAVAKLTADTSKPRPRSTLPAAAAVPYAPTPVHARDKYAGQKRAAGKEEAVVAQDEVDGPVAEPREPPVMLLLLLLLLLLLKVRAIAAAAAAAAAASDQVNERAHGEAVEPPGRHGVHGSSKDSVDGLGEVAAPAPHFVVFMPTPTTVPAASPRPFISRSEQTDRHTRRGFSDVHQRRASIVPAPLPLRRRLEDQHRRRRALAVEEHCA